MCCPSAIVAVDAGMFHTDQCVNEPPGASGSSTVIASDFVPGGIAEIVSGGLELGPAQGYFDGIAPLFGNAELASIIPCGVPVGAAVSVVAVCSAGREHAMARRRAKGMRMGGIYNSLVPT